MTKKLLFWGVAVLCCAVASAQNMGMFKILPKGAFEFGSHYYQADFGYTYQQAALKVSDEKKSADVYEIFGDYYTANDKPVNFSEKISKIKNGIDYEAKFASDSKVANDFALTFSLPSRIYRDRIWIDGKQVNPEKEQKSFLATKIRINGFDRTLEISGEFKCTIAESDRNRRDYGMRPNAYVRIHFMRDSDSEFSLKLKFETFPHHESYADFAKLETAPLDLPVPDGQGRFVCTSFKISDGGRGIVLADGATVSIPCNSKNAKFVEILSGFSKLPEDKDVLGKIVVQYKKGSPETFEITKQNCGEISGKSAPKNATIAWRDVWKGSPVALYTTELKLARKGVKSLKFVNQSGAEWKIAAASFVKNELGAIANEEQWVVASDVYRPIKFKRPALKGSVLDMSFLLDAPAGKYGRVNVVDGHLAFEKSPEKHLRLYGANTCGTANIPSKEDAVKLADQFASMGFNLWRIHHYDALCTKSGPKFASEGDSAALNEENMDRLDFLFSEMKKRGIYITLDFYTTRKLYPHEFDDINYKGENMKLVFAASEKGMRNLERYITNLLNHVNKYTGLAYKDDPALFAVCLRNESSYIGNRNFVVRSPMDKEAIMPRYEKWLAANAEKWKGRKESELWQLFELDAYDIDNGRLVKLVKSLSPSLLITDQNHWSGSMTKAMSKSYDIISQNAYYGHPAYVETKYTTPMQIRSDSAIADFGGSTVKDFDSSSFGKPLMMTEWNYMKPNPSTAHGPFLVGAYGALNEIGALGYFAFSHASGAISKNTSIAGFDFASDPITSLAQRAAAVLYTRGDVSPATVSFPLALLYDFYRNGAIRGASYNAKDYSKLALVGRVGFAIFDDVKSAKIPANAAALFRTEQRWKAANVKVPNIDQFENGLLSKVAKEIRLDKGSIDTEKSVFVSSTGELFLDAKKKLWRAITPRSEAFALCADDKLSGNFASVKAEKSDATVLVSAYDGKALKDSSRILILHLTDARNSREKFGSESGDIVLSWGVSTERMTSLVRAGKLKMTVASKLDGFKLYALDTDGSRKFEVPFRTFGDNSTFTLSVDNKNGSTIAYELVKE